MLYRTYSKDNSHPPTHTKRKNLEALFLSLLLTALLVLAGLPAVALAQEPAPSFDSADSAATDTEGQSDEKNGTSQGQEALDASGPANTQNEGSATDVIADVRQRPNTATQAIAPRATAEEFKFLIHIAHDGDSFSVPTLGSGSGTPYDWSINWGDGASQGFSGSGAPEGITHTYTGWGNYRITIWPSGGSSKAAWLAAFGFSEGTTGADAQANRDKVVRLESPLTPSMKRDVSASTVPDNEWRNTFSGCRNLTMKANGMYMEENCTFSAEWNSITAVGDNFARDMFSGCDVAFEMNDAFNLPQNLTSVGDNFARDMFNGCSGDVFAMNNVFNLPQGLVNAGGSFASGMFEGCSGAAFAMNNVFNLPQNLTSVGENFASNMFSQAGGPNFQVNDVFKFPRYGSSVLNQSGMFEGTFRNLASPTPTQNRLAQDIIGDPSYVPDMARSTFTGSDCFSDRPYIAVNWGGYGISRYITVSFDTASQGLTCTNSPGDATIERHTAVAKPAPDPHVDGYIFDNWYTSAGFDTVWDFTHACTGDMTLYAKFVPREVSVIYLKGDGTQDEFTNFTNDGARKGAYGDVVSEAPDATPFCLGHMFTGWKVEGAADTWEFGQGGTSLTKANGVRDVETDTPKLTLVGQWTEGIAYRFIDAQGIILDHVGTHRDNTQPFIVRCDVSYDLFVNEDEGLQGQVWVDGSLLDPSADYTSASGSTVITLNPSYLSTLAQGEHTLKVVFKDGAAEASFSVDVPASRTVANHGASKTLLATGDAGLRWVVALAGFAGAALVLVLTAGAMRKKGLEHTE